MEETLIIATISYYNKNKIIKNWNEALKCICITKTMPNVHDLTIWQENKTTAVVPYKTILVPNQPAKDE